MFVNALFIFKRIYLSTTNKLDSCANALPFLTLRLVLAWEFGEAGFEKLNGTNWFADITFPFPLSLLPPDVSWSLALSLEIIGAFALLFGVATRFFSFALLIITVVAIVSVHWPQGWTTIGEFFTGYRIIDESDDGFGNYKLPVIYIAMLLPLIFAGAGRLSWDYYLKKVFKI